jgi:Ca2+-transporting ATPase
LAARAGVLSVCENPWAGSLLVEHDEALGAEAIMEAAHDIARSGLPTELRAARADGESAYWHALPAEAATRAFASLKGLSSAEAEERLTRIGHNSLPEPAPRSALETLAGQLQSLPIALLAGSAFVSLATGGAIDAVLTLGVIALNAGIGFSTESWTERLVRRLAQPHDPDVVVLRDGTETTVPASCIAPGEWIALKAGAGVPADGRLITSDALTIDESALTGESLPVMKDARLRIPPEAPLSARRSMVYRGGVVTGGGGIAVATATGEATEMGHVRSLLDKARAPPPPMERALGRLGVRLTLACLGASAVMMALLRARGAPWLAVMRSGVALAVSAIPEGLPAIAASTKALAARAMAKENALVRNINIVETAAHIDVLCIDKTGTLTQNRMAASVVRTLCAEYDIERGEAPWGFSAEAMLLCRTAALCNDAGRDATGASSGSGTERALLELAQGAGIDIEALRRRHPRTDSLQRSESRPFMATEHIVHGTPFIAVKGAPAHVLASCSIARTDGRAVHLDESTRAAILQQNETLAREGLRVLAFAQVSGRRIGESDLVGLEWLGLVGLSDPVRPGAADAIAAFHRAGIRTIILTGDQAPTAERLAADLGLASDGSLDIVDAAQLKNLAAPQIAEIAASAEVFARVSPTDKLTIVQALQANGHVVAMTGDGVNDGPALRAADVGIAMGASGNDVARDAADIVLADDGLASLARALARGRAAEENLRRAVRFLLATNASEVALMFAEALHGPEALETPAELFWLNLVTDVFPAIGVAMAPPANDILDRPPRAHASEIFTRDEGRRVIVDALQIAAPAIVGHFLATVRHGPGGHARGVTFLTLASRQLAHALALRPRRDGRNAHGLLAHRPIEIGVAVSFALLAAPFLIPPLRRLLRIERPLLSETALALGLSLLPFVRREMEEHAGPRASRGRESRDAVGPTRAG